VKQPDVVRIPLTKVVFELDEVDLGFFVKLLALGSKMTVKGVMVNDHVLTATEMFVAFNQELDENLIPRLCDANLLGRVSNVLYVKEAASYYNQTTYSESDLISVIRTVREAFGSDVAEQIALVVPYAGRFKIEKSEEERRNELHQVYLKFGDDRGRVISYIGAFRTKIQMEKNLKLDTDRHLKIVQELLGIYQTGLFSHNGKQYSTTRELMMSAVDSVSRRGLVYLKNHNYLKVVMMNWPKESEKTHEQTSGSAERFR
jgi:hypothetical protein